MAIVTIGGQNYTTMVTVATATTYLNASAGVAPDAWRAQSDPDTKGRDVVQADRFLYALPWAGTQTVATQGTAWPRNGVSGVPDGTTPQDVLDAECELAALVESDPSILTQTSSGSNTKRLSAGPIDIEYFIPTITIPGISTPIPVVVWRLIAKYMASAELAIATAGSPVAFGCDPCDPCEPYANSQFEDSDEFTRTIR